ncbi:hypothetical protein SOVF_207230 [Spinacia oleracea]|nr:hypothetical protein SOVF_207230 [Spinacia oleracea]
MPSLWKKHKGSRISRLVSDLQTAPKRGGSLVVETGFPTSLVDLFVKNRDKLQKHKSKNRKSKKKTAITEAKEGGFDVDEQQRLPNLPSVSDSSVSASDFDVSSSSNVENSEENVAQIDENRIFVEDIVSRENPVIELHRKSCENQSNEEKGEIFEVLNSNFVVLLSILIGVVVFVALLYIKRWFLALITLGFVLLILLEYVGKPSFWLLKPCENVVSMSIMKGALVVGVALYTKWFVVGITIGASLLLLLEYAGNSICGSFKPCLDVKLKLQELLPHLGSSKPRKEFRVRSVRRAVLTRSSVIGSKREVCKKDSDQEGVENEDISIDSELGNGYIRENEVSSEEDDDGETISSKGEIEQGSGDSTPVNKNGETQDKPMYEILDLELNNTKYSKSSNFSGPIRYVDLLWEKRVIEGRGNRDEESELVVDHNGKIKKHKKFWKKLVPKKMHKKNKHKHERENSADGTQDSETELEEEDEQETTEVEGSTTISSVEEDDQDSESVNNHNDQIKKHRKFWKKLVPKKMHKKNKDKHEREHSSAYTDATQDSETDSEEEEDEQEVTGSTMTISSVEEDECGTDKFEAANTCLTGMLQLDNRIPKSCEMVKEKDRNLKYLTTVMIPLTGLIGGRMFAVALTVICCLVFKVVRG